MSYKEKIRAQVLAQSKMERELFAQVCEDSQKYCEILELSGSSLQVLERIQGGTSVYPDLEEHMKSSFLEVRCGPYDLVLFVKHVCGNQYGGDWLDLVIAACVTHKSVNHQTGGGTTLINVISAEVKEALFQELRAGIPASKPDLTIVH